MMILYDAGLWMIEIMRDEILAMISLFLNRYSGLVNNRAFRAMSVGTSVY